MAIDALDHCANCGKTGAPAVWNQVAILLWMEKMAQGKDQGTSGTWLQLSKCHPLLSCLFMHV